MWILNEIVHKTFDESMKKIVESVTEMYGRELKCSESIMNDIVTKDRHVLTTLIAAWVHQPFVNCDSVMVWKEKLEFIVSLC